LRLEEPRKKEYDFASQITAWEYQVEHLHEIKDAYMMAFMQLQEGGEVDAEHLGGHQTHEQFEGQQINPDRMTYEVSVASAV
jgi:hypothetical protein